MSKLITATECRNELAKVGVKMSKSYFSQLKKSGVIKTHYNPSSKTKIHVYEEVRGSLKDAKDPSRDAQREANEKLREKDNIFEDKNLPKNSIATMSDVDRVKYEKDMAEKYTKLQEMSSEEENKNRPSIDSSSAEWNTFKIMQQGLNYEIDRKVKERGLMPISDFKAVAEILISPLNQGLEHVAFELKSKFPNVSDDVIQWLLDRTNQLKVDVQNVSI